MIPALFQWDTENLTVLNVKKFSIMTTTIMYISINELTEILDSLLLQARPWWLCCFWQASILVRIPGSTWHLATTSTDSSLVACDVSDQGTSALQHMMIHGFALHAWQPTQTLVMLNSPIRLQMLSKWWKRNKNFDKNYTKYNENNYHREDLFLFVNYSRG